MRINKITKLNMDHSEIVVSEDCNVQVSIIDLSHLIIHTITLLCHYDVIKNCSRDTKWSTV